MIDFDMQFQNLVLNKIIVIFVLLQFISLHLLKWNISDNLHYIIISAMSTMHVVRVE